MTERLCQLCGEPIPDERNASAKYCSRQCGVYVAHSNQNERIYGRRGPAPADTTPRPVWNGSWLRIGPGHWLRTTTRHAVEVWFSPEGFDWTVRDAAGRALIASGIECRATLAKHRAMTAARAA